MISKKVCGIFLASSVTANLLLTSCSQPGNKRSGTPASADEEAAGEEDAQPSPKKPAAKTPQVTINGDCTTATGLPAGVPAPSPDAGTAAPGTANLKLALADDTGTAASGSQLGAPPVVAAGPAQDSNCEPNNTPTTPTTAGQPPAANTPPVAPPPAVVPPAINPLTNVGGKTLEQCQAERKSWLPGIGGPSTCGDPLVNWCCSRADVVKQFPALGAKLDAEISSNQLQGLKLYHCSVAAGKYTLLFLKSDTNGLRTANLTITGTTEKTPNAPACALPTSAELGL
jgi:hypothetical protein